jgi:protein O-mannosyl-transferase
LADKKKYNNTLLTCICIAAIAVITYIVFSPSLDDGFTNWDDDNYVTANPLVMNNSVPVVKIFESPVSLNYHPLTILSLALNYQAGKLDPTGYHAVNLIIHVLNTMLVFLFIFLLTRRNLLMASIVSLFFGIHPMHVESVTWISERKDVLYVFFFMAGLITYLRFSETKKITWYYFTLLLFILSCLSKGMAVVFPVILLLIDYLQGVKWKRKVLIDKLPFFIVSLVFGIIAIKAQLFAITDVKIVSGKAVSAAHLFTVFDRIVFTSYSAVMYIVKLFVPFKLSAFYPYPDVDNPNGIPLLFYFLPVILLGIIAALIYFFMKKEKEIVFGLLFYFASVVLVLQFVSVGRAIIADRYSYLAYVGLLFIAAYLINKAWQNKVGIWAILKYPLIIIAVVGAVAFSFQTYARTQVWKDSSVLWTDVIDDYPNASIAYLCRGNYYYSINEIDKVIPDYSKAVQLASVVGGCTDFDYQSAYYDRAVVYTYYNKIDSAIADYSNVIALNDTFIRPYYNRAILYSKEGKNDLAMADFTKIIELDPHYVDAYVSRGVLYSQTGKINFGMNDYDKAIALDSASSDAYNDRGLLYLNLGKGDLALADYNKAIALKPDNPSFYYSRGLCYNALNEYEKAAGDFTRGIQLNPQNAEIYYNMRGICDIDLKNYVAAIADFSSAINLNSSFAGYWLNRSVAEKNAGQSENAKADELKGKQLQVPHP